MAAQNPPIAPVTQQLEVVCEVSVFLGELVLLTATGTERDAIPGI
jgi:hypothetical protein